MTEKIDYKKLLEEREKIDELLAKKCQPFIDKLAPRCGHFESLNVGYDYVDINYTEDEDGDFRFLTIPVEYFKLEDGAKKYAEVVKEEKRKKEEREKRREFFEAKKIYFKYKDKFEK